MKQICLLFMVIVQFLMAGCSGTLTGRVIDAETKAPIEGAIVYARWLVERGFGLTYSEVYADNETETDKNGEFRIPSILILNAFVDPPTLIIYKKGCVAWRNRYIFPDIIDRTDFRWSRGSVILMEKFKKNYSYGWHESFMGPGVDFLEESAPKLLEAISWEAPLARKEKLLYGDKVAKRKYSSSKAVYDEIVNELYINNDRNNHE